MDYLKIMMDFLKEYWIYIIGILSLLGNVYQWYVSRKDASKLKHIEMMKVLTGYKEFLFNNYYVQILKSTEEHSRQKGNKQKPLDFFTDRICKNLSTNLESYMNIESLMNGTNIYASQNLRNKFSEIDKQTARLKIQLTNMSVGKMSNVDECVEKLILYVEETRSQL